MKIEIEIHKSDLQLAIVGLILIAIPATYFIYREGVLRQTLAEQARSQIYGEGVAGAISHYRTKGKIQNAKPDYRNQN